jgi:hypothetical protein
MARIEPTLSSTDPAPAHPVSIPRLEQPVTPNIGQPLGDTDPNGFAFKVKAAIDTRLGLPAEKKRCPIPLTDAPLFADTLQVPRRQPTNEAHHVNNVLPPRKHADHLVSLYWQHLDPLEPLLDKHHFDTCYQLLFAGNDFDCDELVFLSTLNAVFALSTQLQENIPTEQRNATATTYFYRAWSLLDPDTVLWQTPSVELVQCLLLIARYLHCTNNPHQTWMAVGSAVRMAQSLGLHQCHESTTEAPNTCVRLGRQVWRRCVYMDR